jgi:hypothetical protein
VTFLWIGGLVAQNAAKSVAGAQFQTTGGGWQKNRGKIADYRMAERG